MHTSDIRIHDGIYRLSIAPKPHFEFNQFLLIDDKSCLIHTGKRAFFDTLIGMVQQRLGSRPLDYIVFSHVEADESGAVNEWLRAYPNATVVCNKIANINLEDFVVRPAHILKDEDTLSLGSMFLKLIETPHFPHNWDAHMWFELSTKVLFSSDFCCQGGTCEPVVENDISDSIINFYEKGGFIPYGKTTNDNLDKLRKLPIATIAPMHGSVVTGTATRIVFDNVCADLRSRS